jgi:hypothetical protein
MYHIPFLQEAPTGSPSNVVLESSGADREDKVMGQTLPGEKIHHPGLTMNACTDPSKRIKKLDDRILHIDHEIAQLKDKRYIMVCEKKKLRGGIITWFINVMLAKLRKMR